MAKKKAASGPFSQFFKEDSEGMLKQSGQQGSELTFTDTKPIPFIPQFTPVDEVAVKAEWKNLRKFFVSYMKGGLSKGTFPLHMTPSLLSDNTLLNYPVWISQNLNGKSEEDEVNCTPLNSLLSERINALYPEPGQGKFIKKIYPRIVMEAGDILQSNGTPDFRTVFEKATIKLRDSMALKGADKETFDIQLSELKTKIPLEGVLIGYASNATFKILEVALSNVARLGNRALTARVKSILPQLIDILTVEAENDPESTDSEHLKSSLGFADSLLDFDKLSSVIPESTSEHLSKARYDRIRNVIKDLGEGKVLLDRDATLVLQHDLQRSRKDQWKDIFNQSEIIEAPEGKACTSSIDIYNERIKEFAKIVKTLRIGALEVKNKYIEEVHDDFFDAFDSNSFTEEEISIFPPVILIADSSKLVVKELNDFSRMLQRGIPVKTVALKSAGVTKVEHPIDPASLAVSHRNTYVAQSTCLNPQTLFERFEKGFSSFSPSFFHIEVASAQSDKDAFIELSASVEGRDFPGFVYSGKMGTAWGSRFDISDNPQTDRDWPVYEYAHKDADANEVKMEVAFTLADFAALNPSHASDFRIVPPEYWTGDLIILSEYLRMTEEERYGKVPFIWMTGADSQMLKVAVSWKLVLETDEKQDFWRYLQDCGGVNSYHAQRALKLQEEKIRKAAEQEIGRLKEAHLEALEKVKKESTEEAMEHLTSALLDLDTDTILSTPSVKSPPPKDTSFADSEAALEETPEDKEDSNMEEEEIISEEPWIETPLCTECNECTDINNRMFHYNADKQAFIADPTAGTFAQLVEAAEICPVKIIHPGKPLNPNEPDLEDLIERASKFT